MSLYKVKEIFKTIQGEGSHTGRPCWFIRLSGCNVWNGREASKPDSICYYCDTDFVGGELLSADQIIETIKEELGTRMIVISGGEPTIQLNKNPELTKKLFDLGYELHLETNGTLRLQNGIENHFAHITCSPKAEVKLQYCTDLKLLFPFLPSVSKDIVFSLPHVNLYIQPIWENAAEENHNTKAAIEWVMQNRESKLSIQTHKVIGIR